MSSKHDIGTADFLTGYATCAQHLINFLDNDERIEDMPAEELVMHLKALALKLTSEEVVEEQVWSEMGIEDCND